VNLNENQLLSVLAIFVIGVFAFNALLQYNISFELSKQSNELKNFLQAFSSISIQSSSNDNALNSQENSSSNSESTSNNLKTEEELIAELIPRGTPEIYGEELGVSFEKPIDSLNILALLDGDLYSNGQIKFSDLSSEEQERYIEIGSMISCEYCCNAKTLVFEDGKPACGCSHSAAMRGLAKYLLKFHGSEYSNEEILSELSDWKALFFPKPTIEKALQLQSQGKKIDSRTLNELPEMTGGC
jgi:hypothetical protein